MKTIYLLLISLSAYSQLLPGTVELKGSPFMRQNSATVSTEAGLDDDPSGIETKPGAMKLRFALNDGPNALGVISSSDDLCGSNVFRYTVYMHVSGAPNGFQLKARTFNGSGNRVPRRARYDQLPVQPLGPRDIYPANGGAYILLPNNPSNAIQVCEFVGCRESIEFQFQLVPTQEISADLGQVEVYYTVVGSLQ